MGADGREVPDFEAAAGANLSGAGGFGGGEEEKAEVFWFFLVLFGTEVGWLW